MTKLRPDLPLAAAPVPAAHRSAPRRRTIRRIGDAATAEALGPLRPDCELFCLTNGEFSAIDIVSHALDHTGPADVDIATWTAADGDLRRAHAMLLRGDVRRLRMLVDPSFRSRKPEFCQTLIDLFGRDAIRTMPLHGKFVAIRNDAWKLAIRTSMNLNPNRRIESVEISGDPALCDFLTDFVDQCFARSADANFASQSREQLATHGGAVSRLAF